MEKSFTSTKVEKENVKKLMDAIYFFIYHALQPSKDFGFHSATFRFPFPKQIKGAICHIPNSNQAWCMLKISPLKENL